jgi:hypothetical protein
MQHTITAPSSRTSRLLAAVGAAALVCFVPSAALGQGTEGGAERIDEVRKSARAHVGPFYATPGVLLKELGVDSNVFNASGEQVSDFTFTLTPKLDVWVPVARRALVQATTASDLVWYAKYDTERSVDPLLAVRGDVFLHRITLFAENQYLNSRQRMNYEIDVRSRHVRNDTAAGVDVQITPKFSVEAAVRRDTIRFDSDAVFDGTSLQRTLNQNTTGFSLTARERITPLTTIALRYDRLRDEFPFSPERDSASYRVMPGVEFKPRALV